MPGQFRVYQRKKMRWGGSRALGAARFSYAKGAGACSFCGRPDRLQVDLGAISGYGRVPWGAGHEHWTHIAEEFMAAERFKDGTLGDAYVQTFETAIRAVENVIEQATSRGEFKIVLEAANTLASIGEMQAGIVGHLPVKGARGKMIAPSSPRQEPLTDDEYNEVLKDAAAVDGGGPRTDDRPTIESEP